MSLKDTVNRLMGRSVVDLAQQVDDALARLAEARGLEAECEVALEAARADVRHAQEKVEAARDALFHEHPELMPSRVLQIPHAPDGPIPSLQGAIVTQPDPSVLLPGQDPSKFEVVEVDDDSDPRFTAGYSPVSTADDADLPPIEWTEHDE